MPLVPPPLSLRAHRHLSWWKWGQFDLPLTPRCRWLDFISLWGDCRNLLVKIDPSHNWNLKNLIMNLLGYALWVCAIEQWMWLDKGRWEVEGEGHSPLFLGIFLYWVWDLFVWANRTPTRPLELMKDSKQWAKMS